MNQQNADSFSSALPSGSLAETRPPGATLDTRANSAALEYLDKKLDYFINDYRIKRDDSRDRSARMQKLAILLGGLMTLLLAFKEIGPISQYQMWISMLALFISAIVTALAAWSSFADYRWKWIRYRTTLSTLYQIRDDFDFQKAKLSNQPTATQIDTLYDRLQQAIHETNSEWMSQRGNTLSPGNAAPAGQKTS